MQSNVNESISANNQGVEQLRRGELLRCLDFFRDSLQGSLSELETTQVVKTTTCGRSRSHADVPFATQVGGLAGIVEECCTYSGDEITLHTQGIFIDSWNLGCIYPEGTLAFQSITASITVYNMALAYLLLSFPGYTKDICAPVRGEQHRLRALALFEKSRFILQRGGFTASASGIAVVDFLFLSLCNSTAYILYQQDAHDTAEATFNELALYASSINAIPVHWDNDMLESMNLSMSAFVLNAMIFKKPLVALAA